MISVQSMSALFASMKPSVFILFFNQSLLFYHHLLPPFHEWYQHRRSETSYDVSFLHIISVHLGFLVSSSIRREHGLRLVRTVVVPPDVELRGVLRPVGIGEVQGKHGLISRLLVQLMASPPIPADMQQDSKCCCQ